VGNSGNFRQTVPLLWKEGQPFVSFLRWSDWLYRRVGRTDSIALVRLMELLFEYLTKEIALEPRLAAETLWRDYQNGGRFDKPGFMKDYLPPSAPRSPSAGRSLLPKRQSRHLVENPAG
jgi:hypothetical protein